jgi:hypothetical protein
MTKKTTSNGGPGSTRSALSRLPLQAAAAALLLACAGAASPTRAGDPAVLIPRISAAAEMLKKERRFGDVSDTQRHEMMQFVVGNMLFVVLHEIGHMLITELGLPVLGREEDAADAYASVSVLSMKDEFSDRVLADAARGWFYGARRDRVEMTPVVYYDVHSLGQQRAFQIVCYMVGSDREKFTWLADETGLPEDRRQTCAGDFSNAEWSWSNVLKNHKRTTQQKTDIQVRYAKPRPGFEVMAEALQSVRLLDEIAAHISNKYALRQSFTIEARSCGAPGAEWNLQERTLVVCYEMAEDFATLHSYYGAPVQLSQR